MPLKLPAKNASPTPENVKALNDGLTSVIAGHPGAINPWTFYEEIDAYLGPWGAKGYPIGYGKYYCQLFNGNEKLQQNTQTAEWVTQTTVALQEPLRDFIVDRFKQQTLATLTEPELRRFAFGIHPKAYTDGGLAMVVLVAPELIPVIATIPAKEFLPTSPNCAATVREVLDTMLLVLPMDAGIGIAALMPVHSGLFRQAMARDDYSWRRETQLSQWLSLSMKTVNGGQMDNIALLTKLTERLNRTEFPDPGITRQARELVNAANARKRRVAAYYRTLIKANSELRVRIDKHDPGWSQW